MRIRSLFLRSTALRSPVAHCERRGSAQGPNAHPAIVENPIAKAITSVLSRIPSQRRARSVGTCAARLCVVGRTRCRTRSSRRVESSQVGVRPSRAAFDRAPPVRETMHSNDVKCRTFAFIAARTTDGGCWRCLVDVGHRITGQFESQTTPRATIASATLMNPAMLAPCT